MKILAIRGKNLASIAGEFEIDFMQEPLRSAGIFAVTGATGAGKSTILDAVCLALYDATPRTANASDNVFIQDIEEQTINHRDSRNILRRGTSNGYAELDFVALNGEEYRSRWSVRRTANQATGNLRPSAIELVKLSTGIAEQGTKKDLLNTIIELSGLSFHQFTRAVLLAQGDFASFLKSKQNEKAELLEKLTGTEIYSEISQRIYARNKEMQAEYDTLLQRMGDIEPLSDEDFKNFGKQKTQFDKELQELSKQLSRTDKSLNWLVQLELINKDIVESKLNIAQNKQEKEAMKPRYSYMNQLDASQLIRDQYLEHQTKNKELDKQHEQEKLEIKQLVQKEEQHKKLSLILLQNKNKLDSYEEEYSKLKPEIAKAKELDIRLKTSEREWTQSKKESQELTEQHKKLTETITTELKLSKDMQQSIEKLAEWFEKNKRYESIVTRIDLLKSQIKDASITRKHKANARKSLAENKKIYDRLTKQIEDLEKMLKDLNEQSPKEIYDLRSRLEHGKACSVCGSTHHPWADEQSDDSLAEEALKLKISSAEKLLESYKLSFKNKEKEITEQETLINSHTRQYTELYDALKNSLASISSWEESFEEGELETVLDKAVLMWKEQEEKRETLKTKLQAIDQKKNLETKQLEELKPALERWNKLEKEQAKALIEAKQERQMLLDGKDSLELEELSEQELAKLRKVYETSREAKEKLEKESSLLKGSYKQLQKNTATNASVVKRLTQNLEHWLANNEHKIDKQLLANLMSKSQDWTRSEKQNLKAVDDAELSLNTQLEERSLRFKNQLASEDKVEGDKAMFEEQKLNLTKKIDEQTEARTMLDLALRNHALAKERLEAFAKEQKGLEEKLENWKKLDQLLGSAKGDKFKTIAQGYTLDVLLGYANRQLYELTHRYELERIPNSLALQVIDNDALGEVRSVHSLSGGESFLVSLSLALGLSSLSSKSISIESLFIDEGFGSLDAETLGVAMDALENLQTQGRKIGVISHVAEMNERISTRIHVKKEAGGASRIDILS